MRRFHAFAVSLPLLCLLSAPLPARAAIDVHFTPTEDVETIWVNAIDRSAATIHVACYGVSNVPIAAALERAAARGLEVIVLEDREESQQPADLHTAIAAAGAHVILKPSGVYLHDKYGVFDNTSALEGSYNLSHAANREDNSVVWFDTETVYALRFEADWEDMFAVYSGLDYRPGVGAQLPPVLDLKGRLQ